MIYFFNDTATTEIYTLSLHDALPIFVGRRRRRPAVGLGRPGPDGLGARARRRVVPGQRRAGDARTGTGGAPGPARAEDRKSTRLNSSTPISRMHSSA